MVRNNGLQKEIIMNEEEKIKLEAFLDGLKTNMAMLVGKPLSGEFLEMTFYYLLNAARSVSIASGLSNDALEKMINNWLVAVKNGTLDEIKN